MDPQTIARIINYYKREDIMEAIVEHAKNKEIGIRLRDGNFSKRPQVLIYPNDVISHVQKGAVSFHASEELWSNPLLLSSASSKKEMDNLRFGWDLVFDIDCNEFEYSRIAARVTVDLLKKVFDIKHISLKFSGNKGFHIGIPWEAFPKSVGKIDLKYAFPEIPRKIAKMVMNMIRKDVGRRIFKYEKGDLNKIAERGNVKLEELFKKKKEELIRKTEINEPDIYNFVGKILNIDTILISPRHLYRMPYSLHEKSWLVSLPISLSQLDNFKKEMAVPEKVRVKNKFLERDRIEENEAELLVKAALLYNEAEEMYRQKGELKEDVTKQGVQRITSKIDKSFFPPCIMNGLKGLPDGRKRFLFILINFLRFMNWGKDEIIELIKEWNSRNYEELGWSYINSQIKYNFKKEPILPPNCSRKDYYKDIGICSSDRFCEKIKNPVSYARIKYIFEKKEKKKKMRGGGG